MVQYHALKIPQKYVSKAIKESSNQVVIMLKRFSNIVESLLWLTLFKASV